MNIFLLDSDPVQAAQWQIDKHVIKMVLESCQLLSTTMWLINGNGPYKKTHVNHPCAIWTRESLSNYQWLWLHTDALGEEYTARYGKIHKSHRVLHESIPYQLPNLSDKGLTTFTNCTPYKDMDTIEAYRKYYQVEKANIATWKQNKPYWY